MHFARGLFWVAYVILGVALVVSFFTGLHLEEVSSFIERLDVLVAGGANQDIGLMRDLGNRCSNVASGLLETVKSGLFSWWWAFFRWLFGNIVACALGLVLVHILMFVPSLLLKRFKAGESVLAVPFISGILCSAAAGFEVSAQTESIMMIAAIALMIGNVIHFICRNADGDGLAVAGAVLLLIPCSAIMVVFGAVFSILLLAALLPMFVIYLFSAAGNSSGGSSGSGGGSYSYSGYSSSSSSSYSSYSSYSSSGSGYSEGGSSYDSSSGYSGYSSYSSYSTGGDGGGGSNLGGYSSPDVGGGYYNSSYGYSSPDVGGSGYYNMNYGYTGKDVGGGYYNMTYGYSSPDVGGGYYNMTYGYSSDDSYGGSYNG